MKRISPGAFPALKHAMTSIYWYKSDLRSFLTSALQGSPELLGSIDWDDYKRNISSRLVDLMATHETEYQGQILSLMSRIADMNDFTHLKLLEDGATKVSVAENSVQALRAWIVPHGEQLEELRAAEKRRQAAYEKSLKNQGIQAKLAEMRISFYEVISPKGAQQRGYLLERLLRDLFEVFDLDPRASFRIEGEQLDGAFTFDQTDFLLEAKWHQEQVDAPDLADFKDKIERKLENTLGAFISMNGYTARAIDRFSTNRPVMILFDGSDLMAVLEGRIDLGQLLLRKRRHASQTGEIYLPIYKVLAS